MEHTIALHRARAQSDAVHCRSNLHQIGQSLLIYANNNNGWIYPPSAGAIPGRPRVRRHRFGVSTGASGRAATGAR